MNTKHIFVPWIKVHVNMLRFLIDVFFILFSLARGFGFVTFVDPLSVDQVLQSGDHRVDDKKVSQHFPLIFLIRDKPFPVWCDDESSPVMLREEGGWIKKDMTINIS